MEQALEQLAIGLPEGWTVHMSKKYARPYYFHAGRKEQLWEKPVPPPSTPTHVASGTAVPAPTAAQAQIAVPAPTAHPTKLLSPSAVSAVRSSAVKPLPASAPVSAPAPAPILAKEARPPPLLTTVDAVKSHYNGLRDADRVPRSASAVATLRKLNNWVKATAFAHYGGGRAEVCDLACGKGADMGKWAHLGVQVYLGIDVAEGSLVDARARAAGMPAEGKPRHTHFVGADMTSADLPAQLRRSYAVVSCQYALHYGWGSGEAVARTLANVAGLLAPGGVAIIIVPDAEELVRRFHGAARETGLPPGALAPFSISSAQGQALCTVTPETTFSVKLARKEATGLRYTFWLADCIDACDEFLVCPAALQRLAAAAGLVVQESTNVNAFARERGTAGRVWEAFLGAERPTPADWEMAGLYRVVLLTHGAQDKGGRDRDSPCVCHAGPTEWGRRWDPAPAPPTPPVPFAPAPRAASRSVAANPAMCNPILPAPPPTLYPYPYVSAHASPRAYAPYTPAPHHPPFSPPMRLPMHPAAAPPFVYRSPLATAMATRAPPPMYDPTTVTARGGARGDAHVDARGGGWGAYASPSYQPIVSAEYDPESVAYSP